MKKLQPILASAGGSILVLLIAWLGRIPLLPADFLPALLPLLIDPSFSKPARPLFWSGPALLAAECLVLLSAPSLGYWIPGMNAAFLCCVVLLDTLFSYTRCWKDALYCRRGKVSRISGETLTRSSLLSLSAFVAVCPVCFYLDRSAAGRGYLLCAALSGLLLAGVFGWALGSRLRKRRLVFSLSRIRAEHRALQEKETDQRRVRSYSDSAHELYARAVEMMRSKKPFLLYEFTLYDMAQRLFTNKMYLSRTINTFSGRGFRSFVNFFRIQYSIRLFRKTPTMKVHALAELCGFHSQVTYTAAFKLEMGMTPGEYFTLLVQGRPVPECPEFPSMMPALTLPASAPSSGQDESA